MSLKRSLTIAAAMAYACVSPSTAFPQRPEFEEASVKANQSNEFPGSGPRRSGGLVTWRNTQVFSVIYYAYHLKGNYEIVGYPDFPDPWRWWDIDARTSADASEEDVRLMFQSLLEQRFKFRAHRETREIPGYALTLAKGKMKFAPGSPDKSMSVTIEDRTFTPTPGACSTTLWRSGTLLACHAAPMEKIASAVGSALAAPLVDNTGLDGAYDLKLLFLPAGKAPDPDQVPAPTLAEALNDLGLILDKGKAPVQVLVIDHVERPSDN